MGGIDIQLDFLFKICSAKFYFSIKTNTWSAGGGPCVENFFSFQKDLIPKQHSYIIPKTTFFILCASISLRESGEWSDREGGGSQLVSGLVSRQMKDANTIDTVARNALNTSREALRLAEETLRMPDTNRAEIERLTRE